MSQLNKVKESINLLKYWLGIIIATALAVAAWVFDNLNKIEDWKIVSASLVLAALFISVYFINKRIIARIDELELL